MESPLNSLEAKLNEKLEVVVLPEFYGVRMECIHKIPPRLRQLNPKAYTPQIVSIGPLHNPFCGSVCEDANVLKPMEETKLSYFKGFLNRTQLSVADLLPKLKEKESKIRSCYASGLISSSYTSNDFLIMIIIDACFIIEHFLRYYEFFKWDGKDPLLLSNSLSDNIYNDLILLENQLPFFVLEVIYNLTRINHGSSSFVEIALHYFQHFNSHKINPLVVCPIHLTDLIRILFLPPREFERDTTRYGIGQVYRASQLYSASQLSEAGLVFKAGESNCLLDINFEKRVLTMPSFVIHDSSNACFRNILAYEEYHHPYSAHSTHYISFLDNLINTEKDVSLLVDKKILLTSMGDANSVVTMVNNLGKNLYLASFNSELLSIRRNLNRFYERPINKYKALLIHEYFSTPVKKASTTAAGLLLFLTVLQTIFSVLSFLKQ